VIKLTEKSRKILRAIYRGIGVTTLSLSLSVCPIFAPEYGMVMYGPGPDWPYEDVYIEGQVVSKKTGQPINGIGIWIKDVTSSSAMLTNHEGKFYLYLPKLDNYTIIFTDIDGTENGGHFKQNTINLTWEEVISFESSLIIELEEIEDIENVE